MSRTTHLQTIDLALRSIATRRASLDAEEAGYLREASAAQIWRGLGMVSMLDYMERVLGYSPRAATERLRVAHALAELPGLTSALADGQLSYSALRELTRVATPETEAAWCAVADGKNLRQLEDLVSTHKRGDLPDSPSDPDLRPRMLRFEVSPATYARMREAHAALDAEHGERLDDDRFVAALCGLALDEQPATASAPSGRAKFQVATVVCEQCSKGWQTGAGVRVAIDAAAVERAQCDAQRVGSLDVDVPVRATQDVTPKTRRYVWRRDEGRCSVPGCRSARNLEIHHEVPRSRGGSHDASNLRLLCDAHHAAHHAGKLEPAAVAAPAAAAAAVVATTAAAATAAAAAAVGSKLGAAVMRVDVRSVLVNLGWPSAVASAAVDAAITHVGTGVAIQELVREALRCCPR